MALLSFCGLLTLQVGVAMMAVVFFTVASLACAVNVFDYYNDPHNTWPISLLLVIIFVVLMIVAGIAMFFSAYNESRKLCIVSVALIVLVMGYWIVLSCFSFANSPRDLRRVCVRRRCAESFWLADLKHREIHYGRISNQTTNTISIAENNTSSSQATKSTTKHGDVGRRRKRIPNYLDLYGLSLNPVTETNKLPISMTMPYNLTYGSTLKPESEKEYKKYKFVQLSDDIDGDETEDRDGDGDVDASSSRDSARYIFGLPMVGAILLFVINFLFFLFTILIMWSYAQELRWADYYDDEPAYTAPETY